MITIGYVIKHIPTGEVMPVRMGRRTSAGWTHWEPQNLYEPKVPRIFTTERAAKNALSCWLKGRWERKGGYSYEGEYDEDIEISPRSSRKPEEMEILQISLTVQTRSK